MIVPYFFGYKTRFFPFPNSLKNLDPSYKMDLVLWDSREGKTPFYSQINTVGGISSVNCLSSFLLSSVCGNMQAGEMQGSIEFLLTRFSNGKLVIKMMNAFSSYVP